MWCRPEPSSVSPIYMPGRLRTASRPLSTRIDSAPYSLGFEGSFSAAGCRAGSVMRGLRDVARISRAKGADLQAICAMKDRLRLAQSILRQPFDQIGFLGQFSRCAKADLEAREKPDSRGSFGFPKGVDCAPH